MDGNSPASFSTYGERGTFDLGRALGTFLTLPFCVGFRGPLGVGKTVMVKGIADGLGIKDRSEWRRFGHECRPRLAPAP